MTPARLLDISRLVSRAGLTLTGVDRVELAYLRQFLKGPVPVFGLARTALGFVLLDDGGLAAFERAVTRNEWGPVDVVSRLNRRLTSSAKRGQSHVRRYAVARAIRPRLAKTLARHLPRGFAYYNTGHSNLSDRTLQAVKMARGQVSVLIHDTIPLDWPDYQRVGTVEAFAVKLSVAATYADRIICSTQAVAQDLQRHVPKLPQIVASPLGIDPNVPEGDAPPGIPQGPFAVCLGTIEPRKNHSLLLDIWADWPAAPPLVLIGKRGWRNEAVFARLDNGIPGVVERSDISDEDLPHWLARASALLLPSYAEGYGLPPAEALAQETPVIVADLPACREVLGPHAVYADPSDRYQWENAIKTLLINGSDGREKRYVPPDWAGHFNHVLTAGW